MELAHHSSAGFAAYPISGENRSSADAFASDAAQNGQVTNQVVRGVRIETCDTCRRYVKSIDLTQDARPIPEIDDLLSLSMDLWAIDEGFTRIEPGLAGI